jgi:glycosyltransferase involved in cell wall biosynthesis
MSRRRISLVIPAHNEQDAVPVFLARVIPILESIGHDYELVFVDDGSRDATVAALMAYRATCPQIRVIELTRNFGKEAALTAGLSYAAGDAVIPIDCDLQDPPELIPELIAKWEAGAPVVLAIRCSRATDSLVKRATAKGFYRLMSSISQVDIPENAGDFRLMDRCVVDALLSFPERARFMKGLMAACGYKHDTVYYDRPGRAAGTTKFNLWKLWNFALDGITSFSTLPLRIWTYLGFVCAALSFVYAGWIVLKTLLWGVVTPGYATTLTIVLLLGGLQMIGLGILGEYLGRVISETKRRPLFLVATLHGFDERGGPAVIPYRRAAARLGQ